MKAPKDNAPDCGRGVESERDIHCHEGDSESNAIRVRQHLLDAYRHATEAHRIALGQVRRRAVYIALRGLETALRVVMREGRHDGR